MRFDPVFFFDALTAIGAALPLTLVITLGAYTLAIVIGVGIAIARVRRTVVLYPLARAYVSVIRGTPALLHLMIISLALPMLIDTFSRHLGVDFSSSVIPLAVFVILALAITGGAYMSEIIRAGIMSVPQGQIEAAQAVGMNGLQLMRRVVLPQAATASLPGLCNLYIGLLHGSSLAYLVSVREMTGTAVVIASREWNYLEAYTAVALSYWVLTFLVERVTAQLEQRSKIWLPGGVR